MKQSFKTVEQEAYEFGSAAFFKHVAQNPYKPGSDLSAEWQSGYDYAKHSNAMAMPELK
jgi:hypothetical protein